VDHDTLERILLPALADLQHECVSHVSRFVWLRAYWGFWKAIAVCLLMNAGRDARPTVRSVGSRLTIVFPIIMGASMLPAISTVLRGVYSPARFLLSSATGAFVGALPLAFFFSVALENGAIRPRHRLPAVFAMSLVCTLVMLTITFSALPRAKQAYRVSIYERQAGVLGSRHVPPVPGTSELTFTELVRRARSGKASEAAPAAREALSMRLALSTVPVMVGFVALAISGYAGTGTLFVGVWIVMLYLGALRAAAGSSFEPPSAANVWLVNSVFAFVGLFAAWVQPRPEAGLRGNVYRA